MRRYLDEAMIQAAIELCALGFPVEWAYSHRLRMGQWDRSFEGQCHRQVAALCDAGRGKSEREAAWRALLVKIAPHIEAWASASPLLRRAGLASEDEARAVLVGVFSRLSAREFENLRAYLRRQPASTDDEEEADLIEGLSRLWQLDYAEGRGVVGDGGEAKDEIEGTPLRGWLLSLTRYVIKDHVKQRFGWSMSANEAGRCKRDMGTGAERIETITEPGARPPITDMLTLRRVLAEVRAYIDTFPEAMQRALLLWMDDAGFDAIAAELGLEGAEKARALVRAGQARLRERFRDAWPGVFAN